MQVTASPVFVALATAQSPAAKPLEASATSIAPVSSTPATTDQVSFQQRDLPLTYDQTPVFISGLRDNKTKGQASSALSNNLLSSLNAASAKKATLSISSVFGQIGALSRETTEFRNEARRLLVTQEQAVKSASPNFSLQPTSDNQSVRLSVKTKDGDNIHIELLRRNIGVVGSTLEFSFKVDGSLSDAEQKALGKLAEKLGQIGDEFFRTDTTQLRNLKDIDTSLISSFSFTMKRPAPRDTFVEHSYEFRVNEQAQTQTLSASDVRGYKVDITTDLNTLVKSSSANANALEPYLEIIRQAADDASMDNKSRRFILDAFSSMFEQFLAIPQTLDTDSAIEATQAAFDSGLPDFTASISSKVVHNHEFYSQAAILKLTLEQHTRVESYADTTLIKQESSFELINNRFEGIFDIENREISNPNYRYITEHRSGNITRTLSMTEDRVNNLLLEQDLATSKTVSEFRNYKLVDKLVDSDTDEFSGHKLKHFAEELLALNANKQFSAINQLLADTKNISF